MHTLYCRHNTRPALREDQLNLCLTFDDLHRSPISHRSRRLRPGEAQAMELGHVVGRQGSSEPDGLAAGGVLDLKVPRVQQKSAAPADRKEQPTVQRAAVTEG
eukprot:3936953-Pleurochrysis_carterae.AAC.2